MEAEVSPGVPGGKDLQFMCNGNSYLQKEPCVDLPGDCPPRCLHCPPPPKRGPWPHGGRAALLAQGHPDRRGGHLPRGLEPRGRRPARHIMERVRVDHGPKCVRVGHALNVSVFVVTCRDSGALLHVSPFLY